MSSESMSNNISQILSKEYKDMDAPSFLKELLSDLGEPISKEEFVEELNKFDENKIYEINKKFYNHVRKITHKKISDCKNYIIVKVSKMNDNGTINVVKPFDIDLKNNWTEIPNPTIFRYLEEGDEVVLGCTKREQKSNCWVEFANISPDEILEKTILKDINKIFDINDNVILLEKWMKIIDSHL